MAIKHNSYFEGLVQSLGFSADDTDYTVGVIEPGEYEFEASRYEKVQIVFGAVVDLRDGKEHKPFTGKLGSHYPKLDQFAPGEKVRLRCTEVVIYICKYSDTPYRF